jgi:hypothetical protein
MLLGDAGRIRCPPYNVVHNKGPDYRGRSRPTSGMGRRSASWLFRETRFSQANNSVLDVFCAF